MPGVGRSGERSGHLLKGRFTLKILLHALWEWNVNESMNASRAPGLGPVGKNTLGDPPTNSEAEYAIKPHTLFSVSHQKHKAPVKNESFVGIL